METTDERNKLIKKNVDISNEDLPMGQRLLKEGFKETNIQKMREIFACDAITEKYRQDFLAEVKKKYKNPKYMEVTFHFSSSESYDNASNFIKHGNSFTVGYRTDITKGWFGNYIQATRYEIFEFTEKCILKRETVDGYMGKIPEQALKNMKIAKDIGIKKFWVFYPAVEDIPEKDPILVGVIPNLDNTTTMVELYYWE